VTFLAVSYVGVLVLSLAWNFNSVILIIYNMEDFLVILSINSESCEGNVY
jgi:hypothetical protein